MYNVLTDQASEYAEREANLSHQITDLRATLARAEDRTGWREDELNKEIQVFSVGYALKR